MGSDEHRAQAPHTVNFVVITLSDRRTKEDDYSGKVIREALTVAGHREIAYELIPNDSHALENLIEQFAQRRDVDVIITTGGTGISRKDITIETLTPKLQKKLDGFGEIFRMLSYQRIGSAAIMSRATAGVMNGKVVICLPGSADAVKLAITEILLNELGHMVWEAKK
jgi:molybdenum cofactor biosynthesis protein B